MAHCYGYGNESQRQVFSSYAETDSQCMSNGMSSDQSYYRNPPAMAGTQRTQYYGHTTNPAPGYNHNMGRLPVPGYQQASYSNYGLGTGTNLTQACGPTPGTGYYGKQDDSHAKKTFRKQKYRDGFGTVEYSSCSDSESDDESRVRRCL